MARKKRDDSCELLSSEEEAIDFDQIEIKQQSTARFNINLSLNEAKALKNKKQPVRSLNASYHQIRGNKKRALSSGKMRTRNTDANSLLFRKSQQNESINSIFTATLGIAGK